MENKVLTDKQKAFVDYYIESGEAVKSYQRAYNPKNPKSSNKGATSLLKKPYILKALQDRSKEVEMAYAKRTGVTIACLEEVKVFWSNILRDEEVPYKERLKASEYIARTNGAFVDKLEHSGGVVVDNPLSGISTKDLKKFINRRGGGDGGYRRSVGA